MQVSPPQFSYLRGLLKKKTGVVIDESKQYLVVARLLPIVRQRRLASLDTLIDRIRTAPGSPLEHDVMNAMMTHETSFFRDKTPFETLKSIIPDFLKKRAGTQQLTIWSAACSTGQEPYSIAILLNEHFHDLLKSWKVRIVATDISNVVLDRGREGVYSELEIVRGLPTPLLTKYFHPFQSNWSIAQSCRHFVEFRQLNLNDTWPIMMSYDIVFLRNVLLYFDTKTRGEVLEKMARAIRPDGALFLGGAETMLGLNTGYERVTGNGCSYYKPKRS